MITFGRAQYHWDPLRRVADSKGLAAHVITLELPVASVVVLRWKDWQRAEVKALNKKASADAEAFTFSTKIFYFTFRKIIARVYRASDSISTRPRISAN